MTIIKPRHYEIWDGQIKSLKKECDGCDWYIKIENEELCGVGKAFKYLSPPKLNRKCVEKNKLFMTDRSLEYLIKIKNGKPTIDAEQLRLWE